MDDRELRLRKLLAEAKLSHLVRRVADHGDHADAAIDRLFDTDTATTLLSYVILNYLLHAHEGAPQATLEEAMNHVLTQASDRAEIDLALLTGGLRFGYALALADGIPVAVM